MSTPFIAGQLVQIKSLPVEQGSFWSTHCLISDKKYLDNRNTRHRQPDESGHYTKLRPNAKAMILSCVPFSEELWAIELLVDNNVTLQHMSILEMANLFEVI